MLNKFFWIALFWTIFVTVLCLMSGSSLSGVDVWEVPNKDKILHFIFYFVFTSCWFLFFRMRFGSSGKVMAGVFFFAVLYGILIELCQFRFSVGRSADVMDALANSLGSATAILFIWLAKRYKDKH